VRGTTGQHSHRAETILLICLLISLSKGETYGHLGHFPPLVHPHLLAQVTRRGIQGFKRRVGIIAIDRVERVVGIYFVDRIEGVVRVDAVDRIGGIAGIDAVDRIEWILGINGVDGIQRVVRPVLIDQIEDVVVAFVLLRETGVGKRRRD
jgi:hypothetical protein